MKKFLLVFGFMFLASNAWGASFSQVLQIQGFITASQHWDDIDVGTPFSGTINWIGDTNQAPVHSDSFGDIYHMGTSSFEVTVGDALVLASSYFDVTIKDGNVTNVFDPGPSIVYSKQVLESDIIFDDFFATFKDIELQAENGLSEINQLGRGSFSTAIYGSYITEKDYVLEGEFTGPKSGSEPVPEPASLLMFGSMLLVGFKRWIT